MKKKLCKFIQSCFWGLKYFFIKLKLSLIKLRIKKVRNNWRLSKNRNFYNPILEATVFKYDSIWKIARYNNYFGSFGIKEDAMDSIFQEWVKEKNIDTAISKLQSALKNIELRNSYPYNHNESSPMEDDGPNKKEPIAADVNLMAKYFYFAQTHKKCFKCQKDTLVNAIILPEGFEAIDEFAIEDLEEQGVDLKGKVPFCNHDYLSILSHLTYISPGALEQIYKYVDEHFFLKKHSIAAGFAYYRSICKHCKSAQGDNFVISEYNSAFYPVDTADFKKIKFYKIDKEIQTSAGSNSIGYGCHPDGFAIRNIWRN